MFLSIDIIISYDKELYKHCEITYLLYTTFVNLKNNKVIII